MIKNRNIIHEDEELIVLNKQANQLSVPARFKKDSPNLYNSLKNKYGNIYIVHRLDKETSGAIIFAKTAEAHRNISLQFQNRKVDKTYHALVLYRVFRDEGEITKKIYNLPESSKMIISQKGKDAKTQYEVIERYRDYTLLKVNIESGRTHQIRVHLSSIGHPLAVDPMYDGKEEIFISDIKFRNFNEQKEGRKQRPLISRVSLHAREIAIHQPKTGERLKFTADYPKDFRAVLNQLNKWG